MSSKDKIIRKVYQREHVSENGIIFTQNSAIVNDAKVNSEEMVLLKVSRKLISANKVGLR